MLLPHTVCRPIPAPTSIDEAQCFIEICDADNNLLEMLPRGAPPNPTWTLFSLTKAIREQLPTERVCMLRPKALMSLHYIEPCSSPRGGWNAQVPHEPGVPMHRSAPSRLIHHDAE